MAAGGGVERLLSWAHGYGNWPAVGPKIITLPSFKWDTLTSYTIDFTIETLMDVIRNIQGVWFDNSSNSNKATLTLQGYTGMPITVPASTIFLIPLFVPEAAPNFILTSTTAASQLTTLSFVNVPVPLGKIG